MANVLKTKYCKCDKLKENKIVLKIWDGNSTFSLITSSTTSKNLVGWAVSKNTTWASLSLRYALEYTKYTRIYLY